MNSILEFLSDVVLTTFGQLLWLLGLIFIFGLILYLLARFTRRTYVKSVGYKMDVVFTGWIGTPVHELGHAIFCIIFGHKINEIRFYNPNPDDGTLGYVNHSYNTQSTYQKIGNFFIGIGPILFGSLVLYAALYYLMPSFLVAFSSIEKHSVAMAQDLQAGGMTSVVESLKVTTSLFFQTIFNRANFANWMFWVFLYFSFCVASHMELSPQDIKGAKGGLVTIVLALLFYNLILMLIEAFGLHLYLGNFWQYLKLLTYAPQINAFLGVLGALFMYAVIISGLNFLISYIGLTIYNLIRGKGLINSAW